MRLLGWIASSLALLAVLAGLGVYGAFLYYARDLPDTAQLANYDPRVTTRLYAGDGRMIAEYAVENRLFVPIATIPEHVRQAFISAEDQHFYEHSGIDFTGVVRAAVTNLRNIGGDQRLVGASTITQQVAKNFLLTNEVSFARKIREAILAMRIEQAFAKDEILELYLNEIYLGRNSYGVAAAALNYFNRSLPELTLAEAAFLAALPKAPNNYNPTQRPEQAVARRNYVLERMLEDGAITAEAMIEASAEPLEVYDHDETELVEADYFAEEVRRELQRLYGDDILYGGGLTVRTTVDPRLQEIADRSLRQGLIDYDRRHGWRGPVAELASFDDWPAQLEAVEVPPGGGDWHLAVVLEVYPDAVRIGFTDRQQGMIPLEEMTWARPQLARQRVGAVPRSADDVVDLRDVVWVEALDGRQTPPSVSPGTPVDDSGAARALPRFGLRQLPEVQGALVAMDPHTGRVLAMSGGFSYSISEFNRATQARRQPGSAIKPFVYLAALEMDHAPPITPATLILDTPLAVDLGPGAGWWRPDNYGHDFLGPQPLRVGIERSRNIMTVRLLLEIGLEPVRDLTRTFGVYEDMDLMYSMALGAGETTPLALTNGYAMIANGGRRIRPVFIDRIQDRHGRTIYPVDHSTCEGCQQVAWQGQAAPELPDTREQVADPAATYQMVSMLEGVVQRGTGRRLASLGLPLAGKTGTTNESRDAWFVGFSPDLVVGTFVGFDTPRSLGESETGGGSAAPIFGAFMAEALEGQDVPPFRIPPEVSLVRINPETGAPAAPGDPAILEAFRAGTEPTTTSMLESDPEREEALIESTLSPTTGTGGLY
ncbi:MAG: penicillin-binding protein 1A [Rhodospirillaceae bacterium]|nr:penicillin-binding protein 1A [Rhodospirillaceae bacterium]